MLVQRLRLGAFIARPRFNPWLGTKIAQAAQTNQKINKQIRSKRLEGFCGQHIFKSLNLNKNSKDALNIT